MKIDLHMHSTASDGKMSPRELVDWAVEKNISAIAITDHEVVEGSREAIEHAKDKGIEIVPGIEIGACDDEVGAYDVHIVGMFLDLENERLANLSERLMEARAVQKKEIIRRLNELGYDITFEELKKEVSGVNYGHPHIARILMRKYDEFEEMSDVFDKLIGGSGAAHVRQWKDTMKNTIDIIHDAGGIAILAHPMFYGDDGCDVVERFVQLGGDGIEVDYFYGSRKIDEDRARNLVKEAGDIARENGLVVSGGGDFHSNDNVLEIGDYGVGVDEFENLKECWKRRNCFTD